MQDMEIAKIVIACCRGAAAVTDGLTDESAREPLTNLVNAMASLIQSISYAIMKNQSGSAASKTESPFDIQEVMLITTVANLIKTEGLKSKKLEKLLADYSNNRVLRAYMETLLERAEVEKATEPTETPSQNALFYLNDWPLKDQV